MYVSKFCDVLGLFFLQLNHLVSAAEISGETSLIRPNIWCALFFIMNIPTELGPAWNPDVLTERLNKFTKARGAQ